MRPSELPLFQKSLLTWYRKNARDLPWRKTRDPYAIWVSEIMLQQTQVKTVIPYYEKWLQRFPTIQALAKAPLEEVLKYWAGLGYYRRARMLHQAAKSLMIEHSAERKAQNVKSKNSSAMRYAPCALPNDVKSLMKIPGIGRYTAGAIASIAFEEKVPVLDGNVIRILTRIYALKEDISSPKTIQKLWGLAENLISSLSSQQTLGSKNSKIKSMGSRFRGNDEGLIGPRTFTSRFSAQESADPSFGGNEKPAGNDMSPGDFNQALMELGATVCFPQKPTCLICPVQNFCQGKKDPERFPVNKKKEAAEELQTAALLIRQEKKILVQQQSLKDRWGGLWMFPHWPSKAQMLKETGLAEDALKPKMTIKHGFTKYRIKLHVYEHSLPAGQAGAERKAQSIEKLNAMSYAPCVLQKGKWVTFSKLKTLPFPSPHQKIVNALLGYGK